MKLRIPVAMWMVAVAGMLTLGALAQDAAPAAAGAAPAAGQAGELVPAEGAAPASSSGGTGFIAVLLSSGWLGVVLWLFLFGAGGAGIYFIVDCAITIRAKRVMPQSLIDKVTQAMQEGDVLKALKECENEPSPLANILSSGFSHVEEGFDIIQEAISTAADLEVEKLMQKLTWISVCANIAPMLGLLGTVQGMIMAFAGIATGAPDVGMLALAISQALFTTAGGLVVAIPCVAIFYSLRNNANRLILRMEALTMEMIKDLRNVEVVAE